jgi:uncharacterized protein YodC (DUF2158 family)
MQITNKIITMKTYTEEELQAAIDNAILLFGRENGKSWEQLADNRLAIAKTFLEKLEPADPYAELKKAHAEGKAIQYQSANGSWHDLEDFNFCTLAENYRIKPEPDPYAALKKAHAEGKAIQRNIHSGIGSAAAYWQDKANADWSWPVDTYRIKPEPETFEAHGKTWTRHKSGDPIPCDRKAQVEVIYGADNEWLSKQSAQWWNWISGTITGWRYADEPTPEPLETKPGTPAVGDVVRLKSTSPKMTVISYDASDDGFWCAWFHKDGCKDEAFFPQTCLTLVTE